MSANTVEASLPPAVGCYRRRAASSTRHHRRLCPFLRAVAVAATAASFAILDHPFISSAWCRASACLHPQARVQLLLQQLPPPSASTYCGSSYFLLRMWLSSALVASQQHVIAPCGLLIFLVRPAASSLVSSASPLPQYCPSPLLLGLRSPSLDFGITPFLIKVWNLPLLILLITCSFSCLLLFRF